MSSQEKKKYPKGFYDDGLGDILEWIDDEILAEPLTTRSKRSNDNDEETKGSLKSKKKKTNKHDASPNSRPAPRRQVELYGDNDLYEIDRKATAKRLRTVEDLDEYGNEIVKRADKKLEDKIRGLVNRLSAPTVPFVSGEFVKLYSTNPRSNVNSALFNNIDSSLISKTAIAKRKIAAELMLLVSYLNHKISHSIGASLVHHLIRLMDQLYKDGSSDDDKRLDNIVLCLSNLYIIGLINANVIFELTRRICSHEGFRVKSVELLLVVFKNIGFQLRKDNPSKMVELIKMLTDEQSEKLQEFSKQDSRIQFLVDSLVHKDHGALNAIKNNNISKIVNYGCDIDKDTIESTLKGLLKRTKLPDTLCDATYDDILTSANFHMLETRLEEEQAEIDGKLSSSSNMSNKLNFVGSKMEAKICKALGLNKPAEKTILSALLKVTDYIEASNIIIGFGMNHCSDALVVCVHLAIHEKKYNLFYFNLINNLCKFHRKYKMAAKFAIQDKIRALSGMPSSRVDIFKRLTYELIRSDAIPITVLKSIEWASLDQSTKEYLTYLLTSISNLADDERHQIIIKADKRSSFAGAMRTFTNCFLKDCQLFQ